MQTKSQKGYIIKTTNGDLVTLFAHNAKEAKTKFHKVHHGTIKRIKVSRKHKGK